MESLPRALLNGGLSSLHCSSTFLRFDNMSLKTPDVTKLTAKRNLVKNYPRATWSWVNMQDPCISFWRDIQVGLLTNVSAPQGSFSLAGALKRRTGSCCLYLQDTRREMAWGICMNPQTCASLRGCLSLATPSVWDPLEQSNTVIFVSSIWKKLNFQQGARAV